MSILISVLIPVLPSSIGNSITIGISACIDTSITHQYWYEEDDEAQPFSK